MRYQTFSDTFGDFFEVALLVPTLSQRDMLREYIDAHSLDPAEVIGYELHQTGKKTPATVQREFLDELIPTLIDLGVKYLMVGDTEYFKTLAGVQKGEAYLGYAMPIAYPEGAKDQLTVFYCPNYRQVFHNPGPTRAKISQAFDALWTHRKGRYRDPGCDIISFAAYPTTVADIAAWLQRLIDMDKPLAADIETFSLKHHSAGIGTISFAWSKHEGIAFPVDLSENPAVVRQMLTKFFMHFEQKIMWHRVAFDVYVLVYQLFMEDICDTEGLLEGLEVMLKNWDCTLLISYLATNSCAGNELGLKAQSQEFSGNYAVEGITDITQIPLSELLQYNLIDTLSTWFVYEKHWQTVIDDQQLEIYETLFKPAMKDIIQMQLTGLPVDMGMVAKVKEALGAVHSDALRAIQGQYLTKNLVQMMTEEAQNEHYEDWLERKAAGVKVREYKPKSFSIEFNPNSGPQTQRLLYELAGLPEIEKTKAGQPSTKREVLEKLKAYTDKPQVLSLLDAFLDYAAVDKILGTFIPAMEEAVLGPDGSYYMFGNFNLGGTKSGRLSSSDPNLQNLPANVVMTIKETLYKAHEHILKHAMSKGKLSLGKLIKMCVKPPKGWLFVGLDFASLEDRISALTTKDPQKLKVYLATQTYQLTIDGTCHHIQEDTIISYDGKTFTGAEFYERYGADCSL